MPMMLQPPYDPNQAQMAAPVDPHDTLTVPISAPPPEIRMTQDAGMPDIPTMAAPKVNGPASIDGQKLRAEDKLMADQAKDADPYGSADNHPGFFGKLLHGLGVAGDVIAPHTMSRIPGTKLNRAAEESGLEKQIGDIGKEESAENLQGAQAANQNAEAGKAAEDTEEMPGQAADRHALSGATVANLESETNMRNNPRDTNPDMATYRALTNMGMKPSEALQEIEKDKALGLKPPTEQPKPVQVNGKSQFAIETPNGWIDAQSHAPIQGNVVPIPPQPNYGQLIMPSKTITAMVNGIPTIMQWDEKTQSYDKPAGQSASGAYPHSEEQAGAVQRAGEGLIKEIQANRSKLGNTQAIIESAILGTPWADPTTAGIRSQIASFAALNPAMHGFRGSDALHQFEKIIGGIPNNPDALIAAIQGIEKTAGAINPQLQHSQQSSGQSGPKVGEVVKGYKFLGGNPRDRKSWEKAQ